MASDYQCVEAAEYGHLQIVRLLLHKTSHGLFEVKGCDDESELKPTWQRKTTWTMIVDKFGMEEAIDIIHMNEIRPDIIIGLIPLADVKFIIESMTVSRTINDNGISSCLNTALSSAIQKANQKSNQVYWDCYFKQIIQFIFTKMEENTSTFQKSLIESHHTINSKSLSNLSSNESRSPSPTKRYHVERPQRRRSPTNHSRALRQTQSMRPVKKYSVAGVVPKLHRRKSDFGCDHINELDESDHIKETDEKIPPNSSYPTKKHSEKNVGLSKRRKNIYLWAVRAVLLVAGSRSHRN